MGEVIGLCWGAPPRFIDSVRRLFIGLVFGLAVGLGQFTDSSALQASECQGLLYEVSQIGKQEFEKKDRSLKHIITNSLVWLVGVDAARAALGFPSFDSTFLSNTVIDVTATAAAHQVSMGHLPGKLKKYIEGRENYKRRTWLNTSMAMAITLAFWAVGASHNGAPVGDAMAWLQGDVIPHSATAMVFALTWGIYKIHPYSKSFMFRTLPLRRDHKKFESLQQDYPQEMAEVQKQVDQRASELGLHKQGQENLAMVLLELARSNIKYEERLSSELIEDNRDIRKIIRKIEQTEDRSKKRKLRKKLISKLLKHYDSNEVDRAEIRKALDLGKPFDLEQSVELHRSLGQHEFQQWKALGLTAFIDQAMWVGLAGGVIFRAITEHAMH